MLTTLRQLAKRHDGIWGLGRFFAEEVRRRGLLPTIRLGIEALWAPTEKAAVGKTENLTIDTSRSTGQVFSVSTQNPNSNTPDVSVIIPCFSQAEFLDRAVKSVALSTSLLHECIVIDDGNFDRSQVMHLENLLPAAEHQILRIIRKSNAGLAAARNTGLLHAEGEFVKFLDSDDLLIDGQLDVELGVLRSEERDVLISDYMVWDSNNWQKFFRRPYFHETAMENLNLVNELSALNLFRDWEESLSIPIHSATFRRSRLLPFETSLRSKEDFFFWVSLLDAGLKFTYRDFTSAIYVVHQKQMTKSSKERNGAYFIEALYRIHSRGLVPEIAMRQKLTYCLDFYGAEAVNTWLRSNPSDQKTTWYKSMRVKH